MRRRTFLTDSATLMTIPVAGCTAAFDEEREGVTITHVELGNASDEPRVFDLLVTQGEEIIHWASHEVDVGKNSQEMGGTVIDIDGPNDPGHVEVSVRVGEKWERTDFNTDRYDGERVIAVVVYGMLEEETLRISRLISDRSATD